MCCQGVWLRRATIVLDSCSELRLRPRAVSLTCKQTFRVASGESLPQLRRLQLQRRLIISAVESVTVHRSMGKRTAVRDSDECHMSHRRAAHLATHPTPTPFLPSAAAISTEEPLVQCWSYGIRLATRVCGRTHTVPRHCNSGRVRDAPLPRGNDSQSRTAACVVLECWAAEMIVHR